ncbi:MAG: hypothetical protein JWO60_2567 [Frankiales bacterium]|nr:hypothetical protein [Frankiales bacterium]
MSVELLDREARSLVQRLRVWTPTRWAAQVRPGLTRGDLAHHLAQALVDAAAEAPVPLPRLEADLALPDQLAVAADDLVRSGPDPDVAAGAVAHLLLHRADLLGDDVPPGLVTALGLGDVLAVGRRLCDLPGLNPGAPAADPES